jgi:hypothetical protein
MGLIDRPAIWRVVRPARKKHASSWAETFAAVQEESQQTPNSASSSASDFFAAISPTFSCCL